MKKIGIKSGTFRFILPHHIYMFQQCKKYCDELIVLTNKDDYIKEKKGIVPISLAGRLKILRSIKYIDEVGCFSGPSEEEWIRAHKLLHDVFGEEKLYWIVFHSSELRGQEHVPGQGIVDEIIYIGHIKSESTSKIIERIKNDSNSSYRKI